MPEMPQQPQQPAQLDRTTSARNSLACLIGSVLTSVLLSGLPLWMQAAALLFAALLVWQRVVLCLFAILILCVGYRLFFAWRFHIAQPGFTATDIVFALSMIAFVASSLRYLEVERSRSRRVESEGMNRLPSGSNKASLLGLSSSLLRIPVALALALTLLAFLPEEALWPNRFRFDPAVFRTLVLVWLFLIVIVLPASVISLLKWRRLRTSQAKIYLRRVAAEELRREQKLVELSRNRRNQKQTSKQQVKHVVTNS
jgi:membrane protein implicated in regulation of membrane protease activity